MRQEIKLKMVPLPAVGDRLTVAGPSVPAWGVGIIFRVKGVDQDGFMRLEFDSPAEAKKAEKRARDAIG